MKETARKLISRGLVASGATALGRRLSSQSGALILYGHRVSADNEGYMQGLPPTFLDDQLAYLCRHFEIISLEVLVDCLEHNRPVPERSLVLTFDDGFRDNYENAFPLLQKHDVPATIFLTTGCLDSGQLPWSQRLGYLFQQTGLAVLKHPLLAEEMPLSSPAQRRRAYQAVKIHVPRMNRERREELLAELSGTLGVEPPADRMMTWQQAKEMQAAGIEMGAHTVSHSLLADIDFAEARQEMVDSRDALRMQLGIERPKFCFPAGSWNKALLDLVKQLGFRSVFIPGQGRVVNQVGRVDCFSMARIGLPNSPAYILEAELDGPLHLVRKVYRS